MAYDAVGNLLSLTDPEDNETTWVYDKLNRATSETNELSETRSFVYDAVGNVTQKTDRLGRVTEYVYDHRNRLTTEVWKSRRREVGGKRNGAVYKWNDICTVVLVGPSACHFGGTGVARPRIDWRPSVDHSAASGDSC